MSRRGIDIKMFSGEVVKKRLTTSNATIRKRKRKSEMSLRKER